MRRRTIVNRVGAVGAVLVLAESSGRGQVAPSLANCADELTAQRRTWGAVAPPIAQPPLDGGDLMRHWRTSGLGVWLVEHTTVAGATLTRVSPDRLTQVRWAATCVATRDERPRVPASEPAFTDSDLAALLGQQTSGVIYLWSPHMPLSVDGYAALRRAAEARRLVVVALLDPRANRVFAAASVGAGHLPAPALRVLDSVELQFRELALHAPSITVFDRGALLPPLLRGFRSAEEYGTFLDRVLAAR